MSRRPFLGARYNFARDPQRDPDELVSHEVEHGIKSELNSPLPSSPWPVTGQERLTAGQGTSLPGSWPSLAANKKGPLNPSDLIYKMSIPSSLGTALGLGLLGVGPPGCN